MKNNITLLRKISLVTIGLSVGIAYSSKAQTVNQNDSSRRASSIISNNPDSLAVLFSQTTGKVLNTGALGYLNGKVLESTPNSFIFHGLTGRIAGLSTTQFSGIPGLDDVSLSLRGRSPLVLMDGVPRNISELNPEQVESVTVLKDAISTVMLGQRSMNGAVLITTRKGDKEREYTNFNVKAQVGLQAPVIRRKYLNAFDYATLYNEALANDGRPELYTAADLQAYQDKSNPFLRPDVDWQKQIYRDNAAFGRANVFADGKTKALRYMLTLDYLAQGGLLNELDSNKYATNASYKRYILRSNIDLRISKSMQGFLNLYGRLNESNAPAGGNLAAITSELNTTPNNAYPVNNPDGTLGGSVNYPSNLWGRSTYNGYFQNLARQAFFDFGVRQSLDSWVKGLSMSGKVSFSSNSNLTTNRSKVFGVVNYSVNASGQPVYTRLANPVTQTNVSGVTISDQVAYVELLTKYDRRFKKHGVHAVATANSENYKVFSSGVLPRKITNYAASVKYDWDERYIVEGAASYSGLNYYRDGLQYGFFPAVGLGWNLHKENFMQSVKAIDEFKIRGSYGLTAGTNQGNFNFQPGYVFSGQYNFGPTGTAVGGLIEGPIPYDNTWSEALKLNLGFDASFIDKQLWVSFDYFTSNQSKLPLRKGNDPAILGLTYPILYIGQSDIKGFEASVGFTGKQKRRFNYAVEFNGSASRTQVIFNDEQVAGFPNLVRTGTYSNQNFGYVADGFVTTAGQGPVVTGYASKPGDLKYKDLNGDATIDFRDVTAIGNAKPVFNYGMTTQLSYDKFYLSFLVQGVANTDVALSGNTIFPFLNNGTGGITQAFPETKNRWTPQTASTATFPRLTIGGNPNNYANSSFWLRSTSFVRLKNAEIGYSFTSKALKSIKIKGIRVFVNGQNLLTVSDFKTFDPEMPFSDYAIQKVVNAGLSVTF